MIERIHAPRTAGHLSAKPIFFPTFPNFRKKWHSERISRAWRAVLMQQLSGMDTKAIGAAAADAAAEECRQLSWERLDGTAGLVADMLAVELIEDILPSLGGVVVGDFPIFLIKANLAFLFLWAVAFDAVVFEERLELFGIQRSGFGRSGSGREE